MGAFFDGEKMLGRKILYTDYASVDYDNIIEILNKVIEGHKTNANDCNYLLDYCDGEQPKIRDKVSRKEIDHWVIDDLCSYIAEFKEGFEWGNPITLVQSNDADEEDNLTKAISMLNRCYRMVGISKKTQELARFVEVCGIGYTYVDVNTDYEDGESYFKLDVLNPMTTFVVRSKAYVDKRIILAVTYCENKTEGTIDYTCFTKESRYEIRSKGGKTFHKPRSGEKNPLNAIPIIEWIRDFNRQGCFEKFISLQDGLNLSISDFLNDVDQNTNAIWHGNDIEFKTKTIEEINEDGTTTEKEILVKPLSGDWILTETTQDGRTPFVKPMTLPYDYTGMLSYMASTRAEILRLAHVPERNDNSGGSTGVAMSDAAGWTDAEAEACRKEMIMTSQKMEEVRVVLRAIKNSSDLDMNSPLNILSIADVVPNFKRSKTYDLTSKVNAICTMISHGFDIEDAVSNVPLFEDPAQVILNSREGVEKYQEKNFGEEEDMNPTRSASDLSYQEENSPNLGNV